MLHGVYGEEKRGFLQHLLVCAIHKPRPDLIEEVCGFTPCCSSSSPPLMLPRSENVSHPLEGCIHPLFSPVFLILFVWDIFTCAYDRPPILPLSVHWPLLLYKPDSSSKALIQKPDNHFTVSYTFILFQASLSSPASHLLFISPCFLCFLSDLHLNSFRFWKKSIFLIPYVVPKTFSLLYSSK